MKPLKLFVFVSLLIVTSPSVLLAQTADTGKSGGAYTNPDDTTSGQSDYLKGNGSNGDTQRGRLGLSGEENYSESGVRALQEKLRSELGETHRDLQVTGSFDSETKEALRAYQKKKGLEESGTLNQETLNALGLQNEAGLKEQSNTFSK